MRNRINSLTLALVACLIVATAGTASAQTGLDPYLNAGERVQGNVQAQAQTPSGQSVGEPVAAVETGSEGGSLPFTGLDVALILGVGGVLTVVGLGMRRLTRQTDAV